jgi:hypothetical protein
MVFRAKRGERPFGYTAISSGLVATSIAIAHHGSGSLRRGQAARRIPLLI